MKLTEETANKVYDLLVNIGGAQEDWRGMFVRYATEDLREFRFQGHLGFGGKIHGQGGRLSVSCYHDEHTAERDHIIAKIDNALIGIPTAERSARFD